MAVRLGSASVPAAGLWLTTRSAGAVTLSETTSCPRMFGTTDRPMLSVAAVTDAGATTDGGVVSTTVNEAEALALFPAPSVTMTVTRVEPTPTRVPAEGLWTFSSALAGVTLSETTRLARKSATAALPWLLAETVAALSGAITGALVSTTVNEVEALALFPAASVTVIVTGVEPTPTSVPADGLWTFSS